MTPNVYPTNQTNSTQAQYFTSDQHKLNVLYISKHAHTIYLC